MNPKDLPPPPFILRLAGSPYVRPHFRERTMRVETLGDIRSWGVICFYEANLGRVYYRATFQEIETILRENECLHTSPSTPPSSTACGKSPCEGKGLARFPG